MRCPACQKALPDGSALCPSCGADLSELPTQEATPTPRTAAARRTYFAPGTLFAGRFTIIEQIGGGGMGVVYKAIDQTLHQEVALKLMRPELAGEFQYVERFKREVRVTRQLSHANVCRVHDLGEHEGLLYFSMEWVRGETLRDLLARAGKLEEGRALKIAEKIARGLQAAHEHGVVHRDLKPSNVMIDDGGEVLVMDFGVAAEAGETSLTGPDRAPVTPAYMAPEQAEPGRRVDGRTDLYSLGLVLEEMLTGRSPGERKPHEGSGHHDTTSTTRSNRATRSLLPRLISEDPVKRFPTAAVAADAMKTIRERYFSEIPPPWWKHLFWSVPAPAWVVLTVVAVVGVWWLAGHPPFGRGTIFPSPAEAFYQRGMHYLREEAETLASIENAATMFQRSIAEDSAFARSWAGLGEANWMRFERAKEPLFREEAERAVSRAVALDASAPETRNAQARGLIALGRYADAREELRALVHARPRDDIAWASLGRACRGRDCYQEGLDAFRRAIALRPSSFRHHAELGAFLQRSGEYEEAEREFRRAIELKPDSPTAYINLGASYLHRNRPADAIPALEEALKYEQRAATYTNLGTAYYFTGNYERAAENYRQAATRDTTNAVFAGNLGDALGELGRRSEAAAAYREAVRRARAVLELTPDDQALRTQLALWCARAGERDSALREIALVTAAAPQEVSVLFTNAVIRAALGLDEEALNWLERAVRLGLGQAEIENDPDLRRLRGNPRYRQILALAS